MSKQRYIWLLISLFMVYTQGLWERLFSLPPGTTIMLELPLWTYFFLSFKKFLKPTPARLWIIIYILFAFFVSVANNTSIIELAKYIRFFLYFYLLYASLWNSRLSNKQWLTLLKFGIFLIIIQGLGSAFNIFVLGQRIEGHVGLMSTLGGTTASTFPLVIVSIITVLFLFARKQGRKFNWILLLIIISTVLVGYGSGKRAIFFTIPLFISITTLISFFYQKGNAVFYRKIIGIVLIAILSVPLYIFGMTTSKGFNYDLSGNENKLEVIITALSYAQEYEESTSQYGTTTGRSGTTLQVINDSFSSFDKFLFGYGFRSYKDESTAYAIGFTYGIVGFTRDIISGGWLVMLLTFIIISKIILTNKSYNYKFTRVLRLLIFAVFVFTHFGYSSDFVVSLKINYLLLILLVFINSPANSNYLNLAVERYFYSGLKKK
jgi:hypothetical protein